MSDSPPSEEMARLRALVPLHTLPEEALNELLDSATFESFRRGKMLIEQGDTDQQNVYLLKGSVVLVNGKTVVERVRAGSDTARFPLAHQLPRKHSVRSESPVQIVRIDSRQLSDLLARSQTVDYQVADFDEASDDDWMSMLLQSRVLQQVPAANIQQVMMNVEQVEVGEGEDLIRQGDPGDYYYMLTRGRAVVRRDDGNGEGPSELARLRPGDAFGEDALLSDARRNSTVTMLEDGEVLRLSKEHFLRLIHNPLVDRVDMEAAQAKVDQGAIWLDLRSTELYDESHLPGAINCPFESLRYQAASLAPDRDYVLYSNTGGRAMAGAFMLTERGFNVSVLEGGLLQRSPLVSEPGEVGEAVDDSVMQARIREAEARAREFEERLRLAKQHQANEVAERERHLEQVRQEVDQARRQLTETEEQKREAQAAQEQAYVEMEQLTGSLEALQHERASLLDRMSEIEGLDKQLQARLVKAERELIGERERAESATSSLEELSGRLSEMLEAREEEREQHAAERGELKEELTALQMELEQAQLDLQEMTEQLAERQTDSEAEGEALAGLQRRLEDAEQAGRAAAEERDALQHRLEALEARLEQQAAAEERLAELKLEIETRNQEAQAAAENHRSEVEALQREVERRSTTADELHQRLQTEVDQLRGANLDLQSELASGSEDAGIAIEQARLRIRELEGQLAEQLDMHNGARDGLQSELDDARGELARSATERDVLEAELAAARAELVGLKERAGGLEEVQDEVGTLRARLGVLEGDLEAERSRAVEALAAKEQELDAARAAVKVEQARVEEELAAADRQIQSAVERLEGDLEALQAENASLKEELARAGEPGNGAEDRLRSELAELAKMLEEQELALAAARQAQSELTEALNDAIAESETLQLAVYERDGEGARLVDLENQVAAAQQDHQAELLAHEQAQQRLRDQLAEESDRRHALQEEVGRLNELIESLDEAGREAEEVRAERDTLVTELDLRESEVEQLRGVLEEYVDQIRAAQSGDIDANEAAALRAELEMVREQAIRDVAQMREKLAAAETQARRLHQADGREAISHEAMRQQIEALEASLSERQRELADAEEARHMLEDSIEDANRQLDDVRLELEKARVEADEAISTGREAENAKEQLQEALLKLQDDAEEARVTDLRDDRLRPGKRPIGIDSVAPRSRLVPGLIGAGLVLAMLEAASIATGQGELISALLPRLLGQ